ncbi:transglutaminase-like domain-containing protein [Demequina sp. NBRC 110056]|uniref:transglutaminase-like domain-containing protein n=1 Tax=Demequina sp. NBRC 110056 TaxID=1570345 RepID=UPI0009FD6B7B|nr:transglutaminase-like domain-containing protein [Demequina sp. NBRC 110056]
MARRRPLSPQQLLTGLATVVTMVAIAVATAWPIYGSAQVVVAAAVGTAIGCGTAILSWSLAWRWWQTALAAAALYLACVVPAAIPSMMTSPARVLEGIGTGVIDIVAGWKRLLTIEVPAGDYQAVLVPFFLTVVVCTLVATVLVTRGGRAASLAVVPLLAMALFGAVLGTAATRPDAEVGPFTVPSPAHVALASAAVAVCAGWLLARPRLARAEALRQARGATATRQSGASRAVALRRHAVSASIVIVTVGIALAAAPLAGAFGAREVPRETIDPLVVLQQQPSPLSSYREWFRTGRFDEPLFSVSTEATVDRLRIATLDAYDGSTFHVSAGEDAADFRRQPQTQSPDIDVTIEAGYEGVWVPLATAEAGAPAFRGERAAALADSYYAAADLSAGVVVEGQDVQSVEGLRAGDSYAIEAAPQADLEAFAASSGGSSLLDEDAHPALVAWADAHASERSGEALLGLIDLLRERGYVSHASRADADANAWMEALAARSPYVFHGSRSGHSTARTEELFDALLEQEERAGAALDADLLVAAVGDDEQFATAAALLARHLGFESRVVIGVRLQGTEADAAVPPCDEVCTGSNVTAWAEARPLGGTWAPLDATPQFTTPPSLIEEGQTPPENPTEPEQVEADVIDPPTILSESVGESTPETSVEDEPWLQTFAPLLVAIASTVVGIALLLLPLAVLPLAKAIRRRRRRRAASPEVALVGAWAELVDRYVDAGVEVPSGLTRAELADVIDRPAAASVATAVDGAVFAEHPATRADSDAVWKVLDAERASLREELPLGKRIGAALSLTSFTRMTRPRDASEAATLRRVDQQSRRDANARV